MTDSTTGRFLSRVWTREIEPDITESLAVYADPPMRWYQRNADGIEVEIADPKFSQMGDGDDSGSIAPYTWYWYTSQTQPGWYVFRGLGGDIDGGWAGYYRAPKEAEDELRRGKSDGLYLP